jgi:predicted HicB family RNase H-like nuclease
MTRVVTVTPPTREGAMAKKKREETPPMPAEATEAETKPVRLDIPRDVHRLLRLLAADDEVSMASFAREALSKYVRDEAKRRGIKG